MGRKGLLSLSANRRLQAESKQLTRWSLQKIIVDTKANDADIYEYFRIKREKGHLALPKPVLSGAVVSEFLEKSRKNPADNSFVTVLVICFEEFSSNSDVKDPWDDHHQEISHLIYQCALFYYNATDFMSCVKSFIKFCNCIATISEYSQKLSAEIFNNCANFLLRIYFRDKMTLTLQGVILRAFRTQCQHAEPSRIAEKFASFHVHLKLIVKFIMRMTVEMQIDVYHILHSSLSSVEEAAKAAPIWFLKWPSLADAFISSYPKSEGCAMFVKKLDEVKMASVRVQKYESVSLSTRVESSSNQKTKKYSCDVSVAPSKDGCSGTVGGKPHKTEAETFKKPDPLRLSAATKKAPVCENEAKLSKQKLERFRAYQTPYYPDHSKSLSMRKNGVGRLQTAGDEKALKEKGGPKKEYFVKAGSNKINNVQSSSSSKVLGIPEHHPAQTGRMRKDVKIDAGSPLLSLEGEDENSKVTRWLTNSCIGSELSVTSSYEDVQSTRLKPSVKNEVGKKTIAGLKRQTVEPLPSNPKRLKNDSREMPTATVTSSEVLNKPKAQMGKETEKMMGMRTQKSLSGNNGEKEEKCVKLPFQEVNDNCERNVWQKKLKKYDEKSQAFEDMVDIYSFPMESNPFVQTGKRKNSLKKTPAVRKTSKSIKSPTKKRMLPNCADAENIVPKSVLKGPTSNIPKSTQSYFVGNADRLSDKSKELRSPISATMSLNKTGVSPAFSPIFNDSIDSMTVQSRLSNGRNKSKILLGRDAATLEKAVTSEGRRALSIAKNLDNAQGHSSTERSVVFGNRDAGLGQSTGGTGGGVCTSERTSGSSCGPTKSSKCPERKEGDDSGYDITSNSDRDNSKKAQDDDDDLVDDIFRKHIAFHARLATTSNSQLAANNTDMASEISNIKGLADKLCASAARCQSLNSSAKQILSEQAGALQTCSMEASRPLKGREEALKEFKRGVCERIRARNREDIMNIIKKAIANMKPPPGSDSDTD